MRKKTKEILAVIALLVVILITTAHTEKNGLTTRYHELESAVLYDRNHEIISINPNAKGQRAIHTEQFPDELKKIIIAREDRFFYLHPGINPVSTLRALTLHALSDYRGGASTITQQLVKNLLGNENDRTFSNKLRELWSAFSLELFLPKETILTMYGNTVYLGKGIEGFAAGSMKYFNKKLSDINRNEMLSLVVTLRSPSLSYPGTEANGERVALLKEQLTENPASEELSASPEKDAETQTSGNSSFELESLTRACPTVCNLTIDNTLTDKLRSILKRTIAENNRFGVRHGAIVVIKLPENELLAIVGSPDPTSDTLGNSINMALEPRPIGSTAKPFIYLKAFEKGARPYTKVLDREYSYPIGTGFPLYPKNYDGIYRGEVSLHYALSNSLNVPAVKTLEFVGLTRFYDFLVASLNFKPLRELQSYEYGIALGGLEMDPLTLSYLFTLFPNQGKLKPLTLIKNADETELPLEIPMSSHAGTTDVVEPKFVNLVTAILHDRLQGIDQFGLVSNLNLPETNFAVKTGTSRDYHDTWTVGFTPDFLVTTWLGNAENKPLDRVTGASGAAKVWQQTMELLMNSDYNRHTPLDLSGIDSMYVDGNATFGLEGDAISFAKKVMLKDILILHPHDGDTFLLEEHSQIPLIASKMAEWFLDGKPLGVGEKIDFTPTRAGHFELSATSNSKTEQIFIDIIDR